MKNLPPDHELSMAVVLCGLVAVLVVILQVFVCMRNVRWLGDQISPTGLMHRVYVFSRECGRTQQHVRRRGEWHLFCSVCPQDHLTTMVTGKHGENQGKKGHLRYQNVMCKAFSPLDRSQVMNLTVQSTVQSFTPDHALFTSTWKCLSLFLRLGLCRNKVQ